MSEEKTSFQPKQFHSGQVVTLKGGSQATVLNMLDGLGIPLVLVSLPTGGYVKGVFTKFIAVSPNSII